MNCVLIVSVQLLTVLVTGDLPGRGPGQLPSPWFGRPLRPDGGPRRSEPTSTMRGIAGEAGSGGTIGQRHGGDTAAEGVHLLRPRTRIRHPYRSRATVVLVSAFTRNRRNMFEGIFECPTADIGRVRRIAGSFKVPLEYLTAKVGHDRNPVHHCVPHRDEEAAQRLPPQHVNTFVCRNCNNPTRGGFG
jgi:hypothetical protein